MYNAHTCDIPRVFSVKLAAAGGIVHRAPGLRAAEVLAREVDVTVEMQRKASGSPESRPLEDDGQ